MRLFFHSTIGRVGSRAERRYHVGSALFLEMSSFFWMLISVSGFAVVVYSAGRRHSTDRTSDRSSGVGETLRRAERLIFGWEECNPEDAEHPSTNVLDRVTRNDPSATDYVRSSAWRSARSAGGP